MPKLSLIFSDIELGSGNKTDDFVEDKLLKKTIKSHFKDAKKYPAEIIFNGDIFDFIKCPYKKKYPKHITEKVSLNKLKKIAKAHPLFFKTLKQWLECNSRTKIIFITGNHDFDIVFPKVQRKIKELIIKKDKELESRILFPGFSYKDNLLYAEHGSQLDPIFKVDPKKIIHESPKVGEPSLLVPWGYSAIYDFFIYMKEEFPIIERLQPKKQVFKHFPEEFQKKLIKHSMKYLAVSFAYTQFKHWNDKLYRFKPGLFYHYMQGLVKKEFELFIIDQAKRKIKKGKYKIMCIGHNHGEEIHKVKNCFIINTGPWRDEYKFSKAKNQYVSRLKTYGYILHTKKKIYKIQLKKVKSKQKPISLKKIERKFRRAKDLNKFLRMGPTDMWF